MQILKLEKNDAYNQEVIGSDDTHVRNNILDDCSAPSNGSGAVVPIKCDLAVQVWQSASNVTEYQIVSYENLVDMIINFESNPIIIKMRDLAKEYYSTGEVSLKNEYDRLKNKLPLITFTSNFKGYRNTKYLNEYTGYIVLDIDYKDNPELEQRFDALRRGIQDNSYTHLCFASPKGKPYGLKVVVRVKLNERILYINNLLKKDDLEPVEREKFIEEVKDFHKTAYKQVSKYYTEKYNFIGDSNAEALMGACFLSGDKNIYYNPNSSYFNVAWVYSPKPKQVFNFTPIDTSIPSFELMDKIINQFFKGEINGRNRTVFNLALQVKYYGVTQSEVIQYAMNRFGASDFTEREIQRCVQNAFKNEYTPINQFIINQSNNENIA
jgi:hypothetical protein